LTNTAVCTGRGRDLTKGTVSRDGYFFGGLNILIGYRYVLSVNALMIYKVFITQISTLPWSLTCCRKTTDFLVSGPWNIKLLIKKAIKKNFQELSDSKFSCKTQYPESVPFLGSKGTDGVAY
jgi:hypothetical protein